jgi:hypothetical protein
LVASKLATEKFNAPLSQSPQARPKAGFFSRRIPAEDVDALPYFFFLRVENTSRIDTESRKLGHRRDTQLRLFEAHRFLPFCARVRKR